MAVCYYEGQKYSNGSRIVVEGDTYLCVATDDEAEWAKTSRSSLGQIVKEKKKKGCYYADKKYSHGAPLKMPDGEVYTCNNGSWIPTTSGGV